MQTAARLVADSRFPATLMGIQGLLVIGMWASYIYGGVFRDGVRTVENRQLLVFHVVAELFMGCLLVVGGAGLLLGRNWGRVCGLAGLGAVIYSTINSLADTVRNRPGLTPVLLVNLGIAVASLFMLACAGSEQPDRSWPRVGRHQV